jgi:RNA polymerase sigma-70 factor, ECF subfamily
VASEQELVELAARGDVRAFQEIWNAHRAAVHRFACWMLNDPASAEDVTQECFLALLEHPGRFNPSRASLRTLLLAIARNQCSLRRRRLQRETCLEDNAAGLPAAEPATAQVAFAEAAAILNAAMANLPPLQREALFLFEYEELSLEEAAAVAGTDIGTLKSRLYRGRQRLKRELSWLAQEGF